MRYNAIVGVKRSGTSALMLALKQSGVPILGFKWPISMTNPRNGYKFDAGRALPLDNEHRNNKNGFWEIPSINELGLQEQHKTLGRYGDTVKIMADNFPQSNPDLIDRAIVIIRKPKATIASQLKLKMVSSVEYGSLAYAHMYIRAIKWLDENNIEFRIETYEDLIEDDTAIQDLVDFLGGGDWQKGYQTFNIKLDRAKPIKVLKEAKDIYTLCQAQRRQDIIDIDLKLLEDKIREIQPKQEK